MAHHAYAIEAGAEEGIAFAQEFVARELGVILKGNPDVVVLRYGLLSVEEARKIAEIANAKAIAGEKKILIIAASRLYHEAQNALLKLFEEPPANTFLFLVVPTLGALLLTLKSRVEFLATGRERKEGKGSAFLKMSAQMRSTLIKKLASGKDEEERRAHRDEAIAIVNALEAAVYEKFKHKRTANAAALLADISQLRSYLYDRAAPTRMILEHLSIVGADLV